jgi:hypothetical protein
MARAFGLDAAGWSRHANPWSGLAIQSAGKLWFLDRMVWLHDDMVALGYTPPIGAR